MVTLTPGAVEQALRSLAKEGDPGVGSRITARETGSAHRNLRYQYWLDLDLPMPGDTDPGYLISASSGALVAGPARC